MEVESSVVFVYYNTKTRTPSTYTRKSVISKSIVLPFHACSLLVYIVDQW